MRVSQNYRQANRIESSLDSNLSNSAQKCCVCCVQHPFRMPLTMFSSLASNVPLAAAIDIYKKVVVIQLKELVGLEDGMERRI